MDMDFVSGIPISTTFDLPGYTVDQTLGLCWGVVVRSVGAIKGITGGIRSVRAGEVPEYTNVVTQARHTAMERLIEHAKELGGNAVLGARFDSTDVATGSMSEIVAYGTVAVVHPN